MGIELTKYVTIKDRYCLVYFGSSKEYLVQLRLLRPILEKNFPGLNIHICCRDEDFELLNDSKSLDMSQLRLIKNKFAHIYEFLTGGQTHPIEEMLKDCGITEYSIPVPEIEPTSKCVIIPHGCYPTNNLTKDQISKIKNMAICKQYQIGEGLEGAGWVIGVESVDLFEAAAKGIKTTLVKTGLGTNLYRNMFPHGEVISI